MITESQDYKKLLFQIQNRNKQTTILPIPKDEPFFDIDLNTRQINAPSILSVTEDHNAEIVYFKADRFFGFQDLANTNCIIQYNNANPDKSKAGYIYAVPYIDIQTFADENKIAFQWAIEGPATAYSGNVTFAVKFYILDSFGKEYIYVLNTAPATGRVLQGMNSLKNTSNYNFESPSPIEDLIQRVNNLESTLDVYWGDVE